MKIYLSSWVGNCVVLRGIRDELVKRGHTVTSRWIDVGARPDKDMKAFWEEWVVKDVEDLDACDTLVVYTNDSYGEGRSLGGMRFEEGYAYARGKKIIVVGPRICIFDQLKDIRYFFTWEQFFTGIKNP